MSPASIPPHKLLTGSFHPDLESALRIAISQFTKSHPPLTALPILVPSNLLKVYLRRRLVELGLPHIALEFVTLQQLVTRIAASQPTQCGALPPFADELIADAVIEKNVAPDSYFARIRHAAGFRASLIASFNDLKESGISPKIFPDLVRRSKKLHTKKFRQLAPLYIAYTDALARANVEDDTDKLARAAASDTDPFPDRRDVFLYGFYDFNFLQRQLIARIGTRHPLTVFFPYHPSESADELHTGGAYLYAEPTLHWFESLLSTEAEPFSSEDNSLPETLREFRARLFNQSRTPLPNPSAENLLILSAPHEPAEAREILRESLAVCTPRSNVPRSTLHEIAVLPRQTDPFAALLEETARARDIPVHNAAGKPLLQNIAARAYLKLLDTARTNLGRAAAMEFATLAPLDSAQFLPTELRNGFNTAEWDRLSAALGIVRFTDAESRDNRLTAHLGKLEWLKSQRDPDNPDAAQTETNHEILATKALGVFVRELSKQLRPILPADSSMERFSLATPSPQFAWSHLLKHSLAAFCSFIPPEHAKDIAAALAPLADLDTFQPTVTLDTFIRYARKSLEAETIRDTQFEDGGIFIGGVMAARGLSWRTVILPGLVEKNFPRVVREDPILLDAERAELNALFPDDTLPAPRSTQPAFPNRLDLKLRGLDEERLLFQLACESAREKLVLTFPRLEPANGRPRIPSMLVLQSIEAVAGKSLELKNLRDCPLFLEIRLNAPADADTALDDTEIHRALFQTLRTQRVTRIAPFLRAIAPTLEHGLRAHRSRWGESTATIYDGIFTDKSAIAAIAALLSPDAREFSPTAFEKFAWCPRCYFEEKILGIRQLDEPEETVMLPPLELGTLVHAILQRAIADLMRGEKLPLDPAREPEHWRRIEKIAVEEFAQAERKGFTGIPLLWEIQKTRILAALRAFLTDEYARQADGLLPRSLEWSFGTFRDFESQSASPVSIKLPNGGTLCFHGRVDRVDEHAAQHWLALTDYKTGRPPSKWTPKMTEKKLASSPLNGGQLLQIPIYALAAQSQGHPAKHGAHLYLFAEEEKDLRLNWNAEMLRTAFEQLPQLLGALHELMTRGVFFQQGDCKRCGGSALSQGAVQWLYDLKHEDSRLQAWEQVTRGDAAPNS